MAQYNNNPLGSNVLGSGQALPIAMDPRVVFTDGDQEPIMKILSQMQVATVPQSDFQGEESPHHHITDSFNGTQSPGASAGATQALNVTNGDRFQEDFTVAIGGINCIVTAVSGNSVTFDPINDSEAVPDVVDNEEIAIFGVAKDEGHALPEEFQSLRENRTGYIQEWSLSWGLTNTLKMSQQYGGITREQEEYTKKEKLMKKFWEMTALTGEKAKKTGGTYPKRFTDGAKGRFVTNSFEYDNGGITNANFQTFSKTAFDNGSSRKFLFVDGTFTGYLMNLLEATKQTKETTEILGVKFQKYITPFGEWMIKYHPYIKRTAMGFSGVYFDFDYVKMKQLKGSGLTFLKDVVKDGSDTCKYELKAKLGFDFPYEASGGLFTEASS